MAKPFVISRTFAAPRDLVWRAWTEREHLLRWFGPKGTTMPTAELELRPGGTFHYCLRGPDGNDMWGKWVFREITPTSRLVLVSSFSDAAGGRTRHPFAPGWPLETLSTTTLTEDQGRTTVTIQWEPHDATAEEQQIFDSAHAGMTQGWTGTFEQLEAYLLRHSS